MTSQQPNSERPQQPESSRPEPRNQRPTITAVAVGAVLNGAARAVVSWAMERLTSN